MRVFVCVCHCLYENVCVCAPVSAFFFPAAFCKAGSTQRCVSRDGEHFASYGVITGWEKGNARRLCKRHLDKDRMS